MPQTHQTLPLSFTGPAKARARGLANPNTKIYTNPQASSKATTFAAAGLYLKISLLLCLPAHRGIPLRVVSEPFPLPGNHWIAATEGYRKPCAVGNGSQPIRSRARGCLARRDLAADCPLFPASWKLVAISFEFLPSDERYLVCCTLRFPAGRSIEGS